MREGPSLGRTGRKEGHLDRRDKALSFAPAESEAPVVFYYDC